MAIKPKQLLEIALGVLTSVGGYLDVGAIATGSQAGAEFGFRHLWVIALGTLCVIFLLEMCGRFSAVSRHTIRGAMRERLGFPFFALTAAADMLLSVLVLASEVGGICLALQLATGISFRWWAVPVGLGVWLLLWKATFGLIENGVALLGLITVAFLFGVHALHAPMHAVAAGLLPSGPPHDPARYWFLCVAILGATIAPYLFYFYSSGAVEEHWDEEHVASNRMIAVVGMGFGAIVSAGVLVCAAVVFLPRGIRVDRFEPAALALSAALGRWGFRLFVASLLIACLGAALEAALATGYNLAQGLGWAWGENKGPREAPRFAVTYTVVLALSVVPMLLGVDPLKITIFSMALTAVMLPLALGPFLLLMNDERYLGKDRNGRISNFVVGGTLLLAFVLAIVTIPLELLGG